MTVKASDLNALSIEQVELKVQAERLRKGRRDRSAEVAYPLLTLLLLLVAWEAGADVFDMPTYLLPSPSDVVMSAVTNYKLILQASWVTTIEIVLGFTLSVLIGIPLAIAIFQWPPFAKAIYPLLISAQAVPKVAVAPLLVVWFGFGLMPKVLIAFLIAFFPIVINTVMGLQSIEREKIYLARSMGLSSFDTFRLIRLPNAMPSIFAGLKISITLAVVGAVVGEFVGGDAGLGYQLMIANGSMDTALLFAGILALTILGFLLFSLIEIAERIAMPHAERATGAGGTA